MPVAVSENLDALRALPLVPATERAALKAALATTLIKSESHRGAFDILFDLYFPPTLTALRRPEAGRDDPDGPDRFIDQLVEGLGGDAAVGEVAGRAVELFGRVENAPSGNLFFEYPVFRAVDLEIVLARLMETADADSDLQRRFARDRFEARVEAFRRAVQQEVRRRVAERRGPQAVAGYAVRPLPEDLPINTAMSDELDDLRRAVKPLARKLATRLALKHRRAQRGRLDVRATVRHSLSTGGVPFETRYRHRAPHRPELFVLCDVSDSVARFARFSLMLVHSLAAQFTRVRSFVFLETVDEVTQLFEHEDFAVAIERMRTEADVVRVDPHSNYGASLAGFLDRYGNDVTPKATLLILGDARNNFRAARLGVLKELQHRSHRVFWLNPEPLSYWDSGDSVASEYASAVDKMVEVRTLRQLEHFVAREL
ncbi:MAG: VWA domain-containing protein [Thermoleophilaceae bacterium]